MDVGEMTSGEQLTQEERPARAAQTVLRLLSGVQRGAEMPLSSAPYRIGCNDDCDIVLADDTVADTHATLTVADGQLTVDAQDGEILFNGQVLKSGQQAAVELPVALTLGQLVVGVGDETTDWTAVPITETRPPEPEPDEPSEDAAADTAAADADTDEPDTDDVEAGDAEPDETDGEAETDASEDGDEEENDEEAAAAADDEAEPSAEDTEAESSGTDAAAADEGASGEADTNLPANPADGAKQPAEKNRTAIYVVAAAAVLILIAIPVGLLLIFNLGTASDETAAAARKAPPAREVAAKIIRDMDLDEVNVAALGRNRIAVKGYVPTHKQKGALLAALTANKIDFSDQTHTVEQILNAVRAALDGTKWPEPNFRQHLTVSYLQHGQVGIDGYLGPEVERSALHQHLQSDAPGAADFSFTRADLEYWKSRLDQRIKDAGLNLWLNTSRDGAKIRIAGELTKSEADKWRAVGEAFVTESRGFPRLTVEVTADPARTAPIQHEETDPALISSAAGGADANAMLNSGLSSILNDRRFQDMMNDASGGKNTGGNPFARKEAANAPAATPAPSGQPEKLSIIGVIVAQGQKSHALTSDGRTLAVGDYLRDDEQIAKIAMDRVIVRKDGKDIVYRIRDGK